MKQHRLLHYYSPAMMAMLMLTLLLQSCSSTPQRMEYFVDNAVSAGMLWPQLPAVPRYRYAGQLIGEQNFTDADSAEPGFFSVLLNWITGLGSDKAKLQSLVRPQSGMVSNSTIYVTDAGRAAVFAFDTRNATLRVMQQADDSAVFISPVGIAAGDNGTLLVTDSELKRVVILTAEGEPLGSFGQNSLQRPTGVARDMQSGLTYVVDTAEHNIKLFDSQWQLLRTIGRHGSAPGEFNAPTHISLRDNKLYVTDTFNARVQVLDTQGKYLSSIGQRGLYVGNLTRPKGVTVDHAGNVYIVESYYDHLLVFNSKGEYLLPIGGSGNAIGQFFLPAGAWTDDNGKIYIADMYNARVMIFQALGG